MVVSKDHHAKHCLSRGQQKIVLFALKFAQARLVYKSCLFLIDDLTSELDEVYVASLIEYIKNINGQVFITVRPNDRILLSLAAEDHSHFFVRNGVFGIN